MLKALKGLKTKYNGSRDTAQGDKVLSQLSLGDHLRIAETTQNRQERGRERVATFHTGP